MGLVYVKRPNRSFIYFHLVRQWCATGRHPGGFTRWLRPCPGWLTRFLCLTPSNAASAAAVNPAGCHPVQLATQAGSTRRPALLISFSIFIVICTGSCTRYVHKGEKKPKCKKQRSRHKVTLSLVFSLCIPVEFSLLHERSLGDGNARIQDIKSPKKEKKKQVKRS